MLTTLGLVSFSRTRRAYICAKRTGAIKMVLEELIVVHNNMEKMWVDEGKTEPFPLEWNQIKID